MLDKLQSLDPRSDHQKIVALTYKYAFPFDHRRATEQALFRTFAIPSIAKVLVQSGELLKHSQKRYDDTDILLSILLERGYDAPDAKQVFRKMKAAHGPFNITNEQYLYVLASFVLEPIRWNERFGYRPMLDVEKQGLFHFWLEVGKRMAIQELPTNLENMRQFYENYERQYMVFDTENHYLATTVFSTLLKDLPWLLRRTVLRIIYGALDERLLHALGLPVQPPWVRNLTRRLLKLLGWTEHFWRRRVPYDLLARRRRSYPQGFRIEELGPERIRSHTAHAEPQGQPVKGT